MNSENPSRPHPGQLPDDGAEARFLALWRRFWNDREPVQPQARSFLLGVARAALGEQAYRARYDEISAAEATEAEPREEAPPPTPEEEEEFRRSRFLDRIHGCLLGGAVGDAFGARIAFMDIAAIREKHGPQGFVDPGPFPKRVDHATSNTQMTLFTLSGLIGAYDLARRREPDAARRTAALYAYLSWLHTQGTPWRDLWPEDKRELLPREPDGWLVNEPALHAERNPNPTCVAALRLFGQTGRRGTLDAPLNDAKDAGALVRSAPIALWSDSPTEVFRAAVELAVLTHGHPTAYLSAGAFTVICHALLRRESLPDAVREAVDQARHWPGHEETLTALTRATESAERGALTPEEIETELGSGESADSALAIALHAALARPDSFTDAVVLAANHSGRSDHSAALCGSLMGIQHDVAGIPWQWWEPLDLRFLVEEIAKDARSAFTVFSRRHGHDRRMIERYPR
ncbi:ADP-ribosylglycohydrolase [Streptoalloteichus tenebrarius]|uniref:ADP-ribosylglycohydrolase n=1 Tax=Streptoalloteichus tenebrarius (strain ATCC 17920 / DSM 40477 / JCM 4838 / CBS 697.72 / NBRC 16177 / NCIMB 11028 / NRRL B-12390 / A12253. 1 / ISP 5477) TaxID=1933 RepID=A0ABT1HZQ5_STRSD|nr:ADP-ribosylglycohydrolase family protein [Streptoalloteichus tenebrarius]MCP2260840.1 ADP-ribosylglycohydrolase [Streptoalloteichus tenebrarius]BFF00486.1 hypothetical protein GCM10020241_21610 [Streptoalloteichus tenebrarius]